MSLEYCDQLHTLWEHVLAIRSAEQKTKDITLQ
jgi:hypothetical protein